MGNVACCKKPNEIIEDQDVYKKSTLKKTMNFQNEQSEPTNPFLKSNSRQNKKFNIENANNILDLENNRNMNMVQTSDKIDHKNTNGPSDNLRKRKGNKDNNINNVNNNINDYMNQQTRNEYDQIKINTNSDINKIENTQSDYQIKNTNISNNFNPKPYQKPKDILYNTNKINTGIHNNFNYEENMEKEPEDKLKYNNNVLKEIKNEEHQIKQINNNINNNINNLDKEPIDHERNKENNQNHNLYQQNNLYNKENNLSYPENMEKQEQFINNNNNDINKTLKINIEQNIAQKIYQQQQDFNENNINNKNLIEDEEPQNSLDNPSNNIQQNHTKISSQVQDDDDPKDSNEINPNINRDLSLKNNQENEISNQKEEMEAIKEAYIQNSDGQIFPTQQISDSEIAYLYQQCLQNGETEPDDDFTIESYKKFYPENDPFFLFDKGEVSEGQIISSPDDIENLEIYEGEINDFNKKHGEGVLTTPEYVRKGTWRNGEFTGWGRESRRNKEVLEGKFINGTLNGKGIFKNSKRNLYTGDFVNSKREGYGELYTNRIHYIGEFKSDKLNGKGIIEFLNEGHKYEGDFKNNEINGKGIFRWKNGDIYEGDMINGKMNGHGVYRYAGGQIYDGEYVDGLREGKGRIIVGNKVVYDGEFKGGHRFEQGKIRKSKRYFENNMNENENNENIQNN